MIFRKGVVDSRIDRSGIPISQIKGAGLSSRGQQTQGLPQVVTGISIALVKSGASRTLRISFKQNPSDRYFQAAQAYIQQGNGTPTLLASGVSPIVVTLTKNQAPARIVLVSSGNWGTTPLSSSPGRAVNLA